MVRVNNSAALLAARRAISAAKRQQVVDTVRAMLADGTPITYNAVAKRARVSAGLVHSPTLKAEIAAAINHQAQIIDRSPATPPTTRVTADSLLQDLELAHTEIRRLRSENKGLREHLQVNLGAQLQALGNQDALGRIDDREHRNTTLAEQNTQLAVENNDLKVLIDQLRDELQSSRTAHARLMHQVNAPRQNR
ncbi:DUF6262 family protein (plasmid) [Prescottella equi]|uniref:DUF6262 family protein n=1 Tax=Rhodococcus hoagii TaxID=43767 RepID=UPI0025759EB2|nr:DUF6262 family protein [Prescottella equi]WJJ14515.1 DUF6262 family protein [Prescottella equi]